MASDIGEVGVHLSGCDSLEFGGGPPSMLDGKCRCLVCSRCGHHTGNSHQGHYWKWCLLTQSMRDFHFCCPDKEHGCELGEAS